MSSHRAKDLKGQNQPAYSLVDDMRDAIWRKHTAARLMAPAISQSASVDSMKTLSIGLTTTC